MDEVVAIVRAHPGRCASAAGVRLILDQPSATGLSRRTATMRHVLPCAMVTP